jgi:hypothetical protein
MNSRLTLAAVAAAASLFFSNESSAQAKASIQDDPQARSCTENCIHAGYEWALANQPADEAECAAANEDVTAGCEHWLQEQRDLTAPPPEEPTVEPPVDAGAAPMPPADGAPTDDADAPPPPSDN